MLVVNRYIADLHFGHENVIDFDGRPFASAAEMEEVLVLNWNSVVGKGDTTYILGDFCWGKECEWVRILRQLAGNKVLILGNHDLKNMSAGLKKMFQDIKYYKEITDGNKRVIISHYPILFYKDSFNPNCVMLCGHVHGKTRESEFFAKWVDELRGEMPGNIYNVGCMLPRMNYTPKTLSEICLKGE